MCICMRTLLLHYYYYYYYYYHCLLLYTQLERKAIRETGRPVKQIVEGFRY